MDKILTIDFDIFLYKDLPLYNNLINTENNFDEFLQTFPLLENVRFDINLYNKLTIFLEKIFSNTKKENIFFCKNHEDVVKFTYNNNFFDLINIDYHHDLGYNNMNQKLYCGNWVKELIKTKKIHKYIWIKNPSSSISPDQQIFISNSLILPNDYEYLEEFINIDKVIICSSFQWIPSFYHHYFFEWIELYKQYYNVDKIDFI